MFRLIRPFHRHAEVIGLFLREFGQLHADFFEVQACDFFIEFLFGGMFCWRIDQTIVQRVLGAHGWLSEASCGSCGRGSVGISHSFIRHCENKIARDRTDAEGV